MLTASTLTTAIAGLPSRLPRTLSVSRLAGEATSRLTGESAAVLSLPTVLHHLLHLLHLLLELSHLPLQVTNDLHEILLSLTLLSLTGRL